MKRTSHVRGLALVLALAVMATGCATATAQKDETRDDPPADRVATIEVADEPESIPDSDDPASRPWAAAAPNCVRMKRCIDALALRMPAAAESFRMAWQSIEEALAGPNTAMIEKSCEQAMLGYGKVPNLPSACAGAVPTP